MENRAHNFFAGPAALPTEVVKKAQEELLNFRGMGVSVMEMSHRDKVFVNVAAEAEADLKKLLGLGDDYAVLFLGGGATHQFTMLPMNALHEGDEADYIVSGNWANRAYEEGGNQGKANLVATSKTLEKPYSELPEIKQENMSPKAKYLHFCSNNTIYGTQFFDNNFPKPLPGVGLVCDVSSGFMSHTFDASKFDMMYAGAQKNIGPAGVTVVVLKKEWAAKTFTKKLPKSLDYNFQIEKESMFNTPPCFNIYITGLVFKWMLEMGGIPAMEKRNRQKAETIYGMIDKYPDFYRGYVTNKDHRSWMNVTFHLPTDELNAEFVAAAKAKNMLGLKGYRSLGGIRASIYNSTSPESVQILADFMEEFKKNH
ncbi:MAG: 3-phosphoserine/phosphohydroxythreonine transaminase [bacterium]